MDSLPPELYELIAEQCDHSALKNLRQVNSQFHQACTPGVFEHFYMGMFEDCLNNLISLAKSPYAKYVKRFTFYPDILPKYDRQEWEGSLFGSGNKFETCFLPSCEVCSVDPLKCSNNGYISRHAVTKQELDCSWRDFQRWRSEQRAWRVSEQGLVLMEHFAMLPNVNEVACVPGFLLHREPKVWPLWSRLRNQMLCRPSKTLFVSLCSIRSKDSKPYAQATLSMLRAISFRASFSGTKHITKLTMWHQLETPWRFLFERLVGDVSRPLERSDYLTNHNEVLGESFSHLTDIHLRVAIQVTGDPSQGRIRNSTSEIEELLDCGHMLKRLTLTASDGENLYMNWTPLEYHPLENLLLSKSSWPQLEHVTLSIDIRHATLLRFFENIAPTLRFLSLCEMIVAREKAEMKDLIQRIPTILKLDGIYLNSLWYTDWNPVDGIDLEGCVNDPYIDGRFYCLFRRGIDVEEPFEQAVKAYLLGKSHELPDLTLGEVSMEDSNKMGLGITETCQGFD